MQGTKAQLLKIARQARKAGFFKSPNGLELYVKCPECGERIYAQDFRYGTVNGEFKRRTDIQMLDAAMLSHLETYCGED